MPAPLAKGIIISLTLIAALSAAFIQQNPQVRAWIEQQRRKIAEALRSLGDEVDPQTRREAEAFAFEGRLPEEQRTPRSERAGSLDAAARATGRELDGEREASRRTAVRMSSSGTLAEEPEKAAERRRLGREYLARRNQELLDAKERSRMRKSQVKEKDAAPATTEEGILDEKVPLSPSSADRNKSFATLVNEDGTLKTDGSATEVNEKILELPSPPSNEPVARERKIAIEEGPVLEQPIPIHTAAFSAGSQYANPFGDEFEVSDALDRSMTPRPPAVPPKISLYQGSEASARDGSLSSSSQETGSSTADQMADSVSYDDDLSYEEQLARALSISAFEDEQARRRAIAEQEAEDPELAAAIAASLASAEVASVPRVASEQSSQLVDVAAPDPPVSVPDPRRSVNLFESAESVQHGTPTPKSRETEEELYSLSPDFTKRSPERVAYSPLAFGEYARVSCPRIPPVQEDHQQSSSMHSPLTQSFHSLTSDLNALPPTTTSSNSGLLIDTEETPAAPQSQSPTSPHSTSASSALADLERESIAFSDHDHDFASFAGSNNSVRSSSISTAAETASFVHASEDGDEHEHEHAHDEDDDEENRYGEVMSVDDSSDEEGQGEGIRTPGSWTDVGSQVGEGSEVSEGDAGAAFARA